MIFGPFRALFVLGIVGALVGVFFGAKGALTAKHAVDSVNRKGGDAKSMFHAGRLDSGLDKVRAKVGADGQLLSLNVYPGYLAVEASTGSEDKARSFRIQEDGKVDELPVTLTGPGKLADNVLPLDKVDAKVVERLARQTAAKEHLTLDDVTHIIVTIQPDSGKPGISVYTNNSRYWRAALDGSGLSNPDQQARKTLADVEQSVGGADPAPAVKAPAAGAVDLQSCIASAGTNATKIAACTR